MSKTIINGIDVSECGFCCWKHNGNKLIENYCAIFNNKCICNPNCYFKQLERLEQENKELKERLCETKQFLKNDREESLKFCQQIEAYQLSENEAKEIIAELLHENRELKGKIDIYENSIIANHDKAVSKRLMKVLIALEEIRNITEKLITELPEYHSCYYKDECSDNCTPKKQNKVGYCCFENADKILTIISEVLNDRD